MNRFRPFIVLAVLAATPSLSRADDEYGHIYRIETIRAGKPKVELTGFKVKDRDGIYTALHGVVGGKTIVAFQPAPKRITRYELEIAEVDIDRDMAYLVPKDRGKKLPDGGLAVGRAPKLQDLSEKPVRVVGFPIGLDLLAPSTPLTVRRPAAVPLTEAVSPKVRLVLVERNSPVASAQVMLLDGNLLPGHSGAPILDRAGYVIAVGNGGMDIGRVGMGWAIPFHDIVLTVTTNATIEARLAKLARSETAFTYFCVIDDQVRQQAQKFRVVVQSVLVGKNGEPVLAFPQTPKQAMAAQMNRLKEVMELMRQGKADKLNPLDELQRLNEKLIPLADGTSVEVLELEDPKEAAPAMPLFPIPMQAGKGKNADPFGLLGNVLGDAAQQVNVKVRVLTGPHKGRELWVHRGVIKRQTVISADK